MLLKYYAGLFDACGDVKLFYFGRPKNKNIYRSIIINNDNILLLRKVKSYFGYGLIKDRYWIVDKKECIADFCSRISLYTTLNPMCLDLMLKSCNIIFGSDKNKNKPQAVEIHDEVVKLFISGAHNINDITFSSPPEPEWTAGFIEGNKNRFDISLSCKQENIKYSIKKQHIADDEISKSFCVIETENKKSLIEYLQQVIPFLFIEKESIFSLYKSIHLSCPPF
jgi:hypothetical protein